MYVPEKWFGNKPGMEVAEELDTETSKLVSDEYKVLMYDTIQSHTILEKHGLSKSQANRVLEPFALVKGILSGTDWDNFLNLRTAKGAQPEFQTLAFQIGRLLLDSEPQPVLWQVWHLPYLMQLESYYVIPEILAKVCAARCARVSYLNHDQSSPDMMKDLNLASSLEKDLHLSPFEHPAIAIPGRHANYSGWCQLRSFIHDQRKVDKSWQERLKN